MVQGTREIGGVPVQADPHRPQPDLHPCRIARMPFVPFLVFTAAGSLLWNTVLVYAGRIAGDSWEKVSAAFGVYSDLFLMIAGISIAFAVLFRGCGERRKL